KQDSNDTGNDDETLPKRRSNAIDTDTDTEEETDKDKNIAPAQAPASSVPTYTGAASPAAPRDAPTAKRRGSIDPPLGVSDLVWSDFVQHRKSLRAPVTQTVVNTLVKELAKAEAMGWAPDDAIAEALSAGWRGL